MFVAKSIFLCYNIKSVSLFILSSYFLTGGLMKTNWVRTMYRFSPLFSLCFFCGWIMILAKGAVFGVYFTILSLALCGLYMHFLYLEPDINRKMKGACFILLCVTITGSMFFLSFVVPKNYYLYKEGAYEITTKAMFISPFALEKPAEEGPPETGKLRVIYKNPEWAVSVYYEMEPGTRLRDELFRDFQKSFWQGIVLPPGLFFTNEQMARKEIHKYLQGQFPYLKLITEIRKMS